MSTGLKSAIQAQVRAESVVAKSDAARSYVPAMGGDKDPGVWYNELYAVLQKVARSISAPPKDSAC